VIEGRTPLPDGLEDDVPVPSQGRRGVFKRPSVLFDSLEDDVLVSL
jgi:hypothetical protein